MWMATFVEEEGVSMVPLNGSPCGRREDRACGTCPIAAIWLPRALIFTFVFLLISPASFVETEHD